jgi:hypothetical protein
MAAADDFMKMPCRNAIDEQRHGQRLCRGVDDESAQENPL